MTPTDAPAVVLVYYVVGGAVLLVAMWLLLEWLAAWCERPER